MLIRKYEHSDRDFILSLAPRFSSFEFLNFRDSSKMLEKNKEMAMEAINKNSSNIYIAEKNGQILGYIELKEWVDYFTREKQGYISAVAVSKDFEGKGVGAFLLEKAEEWCKQKGYKELVLQVFSQNKNAIKLYEKSGYESDCIVMVKEL